MAGYSYFDYDQMTLLGIEVHSDELELLNQAAEEYDWKIIEREVELKFRESALDFRDREHSFVCPRRDKLDEDLQESFPFLDEMAETELIASDRNPKGAGRKGQDFISLRIFILPFGSIIIGVEGLHRDENAHERRSRGPSVSWRSS